jgi:hypothetical protein
MQVRAVNSNSRNPNCQCTLFSKKNPIIRNFLHIRMPRRPDKPESAVPPYPSQHGSASKIARKNSNTGNIQEKRWRILHFPFRAWTHLLQCKPTNAHTSLVIQSVNQLHYTLILNRPNKLTILRISKKGLYVCVWGGGSSVGIATELRAGRSVDRIPVEARFSAPVQTGPGAHAASCTMGTGSFPGVESGRGVTLTPHPLLMPWSWKGRAIPVLPLWAVRPLQSLSACTRVTFTLPFIYIYFLWGPLMVLRYKSEGRGFGSRCCHWNFSLT